MSPPAATAASEAIGVSTSPADLKDLLADVCGDCPASEAELKRLGLLIVQDCGLAFGPHKINKMAVRFKTHVPAGSAWMFFLFMTNELQLTETRKRELLARPEVYSTLCYADPTGETAVWLARGYKGSTR